MPQARLSALHGRIVTMDPDDAVFDDGVIYLRDHTIVAVADADEPPPAGFEQVKVERTGATLYPGLIDLHNHLSYNVLRLWQVPKRYTNRDDWARHPDYRRLISGPMNVLGQTPGYPAAIARYAECKCLLGGVTTSQGIALFSNSGMSSFYRGFLRNPEVSDGPGFPAAHARIADVAAEDGERFMRLLRQKSALLLHLSEGTDARAHKHFQALTLPSGEIAISPSLVGIHCVALKRRDFDLMAGKGASMVWSPLSNLLLYGKTANIKAAKKAGVNITLGADWSPSGSKHLLGELKVARAVSQAQGGLFSDLELVSMATRNAARAIKWHNVVGSLESGKRADLIAIKGTDKPAYAQLLDCRERDIVLVMIDGVRRYGLPKLMRGARHAETWTVGGSRRVFDLSGPVDGPLKPQGLRASTDLLRRGLRDLVDLAKALEKPRRASRSAKPEWFLALEEEEPVDNCIRPRLCNHGTSPKRSFDPLEMARAAAVPLSTLLGPLELDPISLCDDRDFLAVLDRQRNLPKPIRAALAAAFA